MTRTKRYGRTTRQLSVLFAAALAGCGSGGETEEVGEHVVSTSGALTTAARHSLLITELKVVADPNRTVEPCNAIATDADNKEWSLPYLLKVHATRNGRNAVDLVTNWLTAWNAETPLVNDQTGRKNGSQELIDLWPRDGAGKFRLEKAPFRLSAIVSRLDLRNLRPENEPLGGEVRFVFGMTENNTCTSPASETAIILEYSPGAANENDVLAWAKRWYDLGNLDKNSSAYLTELQNLTEATIRTGKLERIRTNAVAAFETVVPGWFMSEFVPVNGWLVRSTVKQTPRNDLKDPRNSNRARVSSFIAANEANLATAFETPQKGYMYGPGSAYRVPDKFDGTLVPFRGTWANVVKTVPPSFWDFSRPATMSDWSWSLARHRFSLGTCDGCHGGETGQNGGGPLFHIRPREANTVAPISSFLAGPVTVTDPVDGTLRHYDEMTRRQEDLHWLATEMPLGNPIFGNYYKMRFVHSGKCLDLAGAVTTSNALVKQYGCHGQSNQRLAVVPGPQPWEHKIKFKHSQMCLDVENASTASGAKVVQKPCTNTNSQIVTWFVPAGAPEAIILTFKHSNKCLRVTNQGTGDNVQVIQTDCTSTRSHGLHLVE